MAEKVSKENNKLVVAKARSLRISPRKMRLVTNLVKGHRAADAIVQLQFTNKKAAPILIKLIKSAAANAEHNFQLDPDSLFIKSITCDMGQVMKRMFPRARGSAFVIRRKTSHVTLVLESKAVGKKARRGTLVKSAETEESKKGEVLQEQGSVKKAEKRPISSPKTSEQRKANTIQQKRRLFTRKTGE